MSKRKLHFTLIRRIIHKQEDSGIENSFERVLTAIFSS